jgi:segregation and condensation protein B
MSIKAKIEAIIYAAEEPVTLDQIFKLVKDETRQELTAKLEIISSEEPAEVPAPVEAEPSQPEMEAAAEPEAATELKVIAIDQPATEASIPADTEAEAETEQPSPAIEATEAVEDVAVAQVSEGPRQLISDAEVKAAIRAALEELIAAYGAPEHGIEVRQIAGGYRMATKPEQHDTVRSFSKSLKPPMRLTLPALETLAVIAYKQPITAPEIGEIRGVDTGGVVGTLLDRKLITTAGRKQVIGRPILYKTTKEFLLRFGLKDVNELPSMEEFEKLAAESLAGDLFTSAREAPPAEAPVLATELPVLTTEDTEGTEETSNAEDAKDAEEPQNSEADL